MAHSGTSDLTLRDKFRDRGELACGDLESTAMLVVLIAEHGRSE
jgi:hypothetical protein